MPCRYGISPTRHGPCLTCSPVQIARCNAMDHRRWSMDHGRCGLDCPCAIEGWAKPRALRNLRLCPHGQNLLGGRDGP